MTDEKDSMTQTQLELTLEIALSKRNQKYMMPLFKGLDLTQSDVDFVLGNNTSNTAEAMALTLRWISGRLNSAYRKEFMGEISAMRKAVDDANAQSDRIQKNAKRNFRITLGVSLLAIGVSFCSLIF